MSDEVLDDEERALLEAHAAGDAEPETPATEPEAPAETPEEPAEAPAEEPAPEVPAEEPEAPAADPTPVEEAQDEMECPPDRRVIPAQWSGDPWGDTPVQMRG